MVTPVDVQQPQQQQPQQQQHHHHHTTGGLGNGEPAYKLRRRRHEKLYLQPQQKKQVRIPPYSDIQKISRRNNNNDDFSYDNDVSTAPNTFGVMLWLICVASFILIVWVIQEIVSQQQQQQQQKPKNNTKHPHKDSNNKRNSRHMHSRHRRLRKEKITNSDNSDHDNYYDAYYLNVPIPGYNDAHVVHGITSTDSSMYYRGAARRRAYGASVGNNNNANNKNNVRNYYRGSPPSEPSHALQSSYNGDRGLTNSYKATRPMHTRHSHTLDIEYGNEDGTGLELKPRSLYDDSDLSGEIILEGIIGGGGFGSVWKGKWRGTPVAIKVLDLNDSVTATDEDLDFDEDEEVKAKIMTFQSEIQLLKRLRHPNICLFLGYEHNEREKQWGLVMELCANGSVWDCLRSVVCYPGPKATGAPERIWPSNLIVKVAKGAARGMAYLHGKNPVILHRDLKSANLLLDDSFTVKIADFGLSTAHTCKPLTQNCGTVQWMAPEVLTNSNYGSPADVYSYGVILWELVTQLCPFGNTRAPVEIALSIVQNKERPPIPKWVNSRYRGLVEKCWCTNAYERYKFEEILTYLENIDGIGH